MSLFAWACARLSETSSRIALSLFLGNCAALLKSGAPVDWHTICAEALTALAVILTPESKSQSQSTPAPQEIHHA